MIYEQHHSLSTDYFIFEERENLSFPLHMHACYEVIAVTEGEMTVTVNSFEYELRAGSVIFIFPYQIHSIETKKSSKDTLCVFSGNLISLFGRKYNGKIPKNPIIEFGDDFLLKKFTDCRNGDNILSIKGILYLLFSELSARCELTDGSQKRNADLKLFDKIFTYINKNYNSECTLFGMARELKYDHTYLSKFFSKFVGMSFHRYVNDLRLSDACYMLKNTEDTILEISQACGFASLRSFNRNFTENMKMTPTEYREKI